MDLSSVPLLLSPSLPAALHHLPRPTLSPPVVTRSIQATSSSNARHASALVRRSLQNVSETSQSSPPAILSPCSRSPPSAPPAGATLPAASPAKASPSIAAPIDPNLRDPPCSKQKYLQSPS